MKLQNCKSVISNIFSVGIQKEKKGKKLIFYMLWIYRGISENQYDGTNMFL